jgi:hypothetical protein
MHYQIDSAESISDKDTLNTFNLTSVSEKFLAFEITRMKEIVNVSRTFRSLKIKSFFLAKYRKNMKNVIGFGGKIELYTFSIIAKNKAIYNDPDSFIQGSCNGK